jgi:cellulose synthase/poly-beta-1,6-N-acetylglucosamine synthase-like glycosyltransferase
MSNVWQTAAALLVWLSLGGLTYVYLGYPLLLAAIGFFAKRPKAAALGYFPTISMLIAAYNEEAGIQKKIEQTLALDYPASKLEIIVLSDCSSDRTDEIVKSFADPRIRLFRAPQRKGKTNAQNLGVEIANGEVLIFSDATTVYHPQALQYLATNYANPKVGAVSGRYQYFDPEGKSPTGSGMIAFWNYENFIKTMQSRIRTISGCCGCIYSVRRAAYTALHPDVISDLVQPLRAIQKGYRVVFEDRALAYEETTKSSKEEFSMRVRVVTRGIRGILSVPSLLNPVKNGWVSFQLISHKVLRWMVPFFLLLLFASNAVLWNQAWYGILFASQVVFYGFALLTLRVPVHSVWKPLGIPLYFCTLNAAALRSILEVIRGRKYVVWETVRS